MICLSTSARLRNPTATTTTTTTMDSLLVYWLMLVVWTSDKCYPDRSSLRTHRSPVSQKSNHRDRQMSRQHTHRNRSRRIDHRWGTYPLVTQVCDLI